MSKEYEAIWSRIRYLSELDTSLKSGITYTFYKQKEDSLCIMLNYILNQF